MKKIIVFCLSLLCVLHLTSIEASDSASVSGGGFTNCCRKAPRFSNGDIRRLMQ